MSSFHRAACGAPVVFRRGFQIAGAGRLRNLDFQIAHTFVEQLLSTRIPGALDIGVACGGNFKGLWARVGGAPSTGKNGSMRVGKVDDMATCIPNQAVPDSDGAVRAGGLPAGGETRIASTVFAADTYADGEGQVNVGITPNQSTQCKEGCGHTTTMQRVYM